MTCPAHGFRQVGSDHPNLLTHPNIATLPAEFHLEAKTNSKGPMQTARLRKRRAVTLDWAGFLQAVVGQAGGSVAIFGWLWHRAVDLE